MSISYHGMAQPAILPEEVAMVKASSTPRLPYRNVREQSPQALWESCE